MFKKLFGAGGSSGGGKKPVQPQMDPHETMNKLANQIEVVQEREKKNEMDMKRLLQEALAKKKAGDTKGALFTLKRKKMLEKEGAKLQGQMIMLEQQRMMIQSNIGDLDVFQALDTGSRAVEQMSKQLDIDRLEDIKERLDDQAAEMEEKSEFFIRAAQGQDEDELLDELNELEADALAGEMEQMDVPAGYVENKIKPQPISAKGAAQSEEDELRALEAMMS